VKLFGRTPIRPWLFVVAKCALVPPHLFVAVAALHARQGTLALPRLAPIAAAVFVAGLAAAFAAIAHLGDSVRVGLPEEPTEFRVHGLYRVSRNPIYTGIFFSMAASCVLVPHWLNLTCTALAIVLHHRVILAEERFLDERFGQAWRDYRARVRRYL
jgi:protein-S-isoprenylcysteine O-methyltransferase Ste14